MPGHSQIAKLLLIPAAGILLAGALLNPASAEQAFPFKGTVNSEEVNIRADSTISSPVISNLKKGAEVDVTYRIYDWYKIRLLKDSPAYINKKLVEPVKDGSGRVKGMNVNIRLNPEYSSWILGRAHTDEVVNIIAEEGQWYRIEPTDNCFGWVYKQFIDRSALPKAPETKTAPAQPLKVEPLVQEKEGGLVLAEGMIMPYGMVLSRQATHKLATPMETFLLKGNKKTMDNLNHRRVRVLGKIIPSRNKTYRTIEVSRIELAEKRD